MKKMAVPIVLYLLFFVFLFSTDPNKLSVGWLLVPFVLLFGALFSTVSLLQQRKHGQKRGLGKTVATAVVLAAIPTFLLLLDSINQLTLRDVLIFVIFSVLVLFYIRRLKFSRDN